MSEEPKTDQNKTVDWSRRFWDPVAMFNWCSAILVIPANKDKGIMKGTRVYPDGRIEHFSVA